MPKGATKDAGCTSRLLKANGFSEAEAHTIIPDRGAPAAKKEADAPPIIPAPPVVGSPNPGQSNG